MTTPATKHTPGPWTFRPITDDDRLISHWVDGTDWMGNPGAAPVAEIRDLGDSAEANARLIAAAPNLLEALLVAEMVFRTVQDGRPTLSPAESNALDVARAAIIKATGQEADK